MSKYSAIIIGGGPAGATCALWLKMLGHKPCLIERRGQLGGLQADSPYLNQWIPLLPYGTRGEDVAATIHHTLHQHDIKIHLDCAAESVERADDGFRVRTARGEFNGKYLVLASGVRSASGGLRDALNLLIGPGRHVASTNFTGLKIAILGGGDNAFENYFFIRQSGAESVTLFARTLKARAEFLTQTPPEHIRQGEYQVDTSASAVNGEVFDRIVVMYGWEAHLPYMQVLPVALNEHGFVVTSEQCETNQPGIFAIGEVAQRAHPCCITSMADGVTAAKAIQQKLEAGSLNKFSAMVKRTANLVTII